MPKPGRLKAHKAEVLALHAQGWPQYKIAAKFGVAPFAVAEVIRKHRQQQAVEVVKS